MAPPALWLAAASCAAATAVELSNTALPRDTAGRPLVTGMVDVLDNSARDGYWYIVNDDWGCVEQVDCCARGPEPACWKCCEAMRPAAYAGNHTIVGYRTRDFVAFESLGTLLAPAQRSAGNEYRPHLVHNARTGLYLLWFGNWNMTTIPKPGDKVVGMYSIAASASPAGPYRVIRDGPSHQVDFKCSGSQGDFDLLVDDDGRAYLVNTFYSHFCLEELDANYTAGTGVTAVVESADFTRPLPGGPELYYGPASDEAPAWFKRGGVYHLLYGNGCCDCKDGASVWAWSAPSPLGPYKLQGQVGLDPTTHRPVTKAQLAAVVTVGDDFVWLGNNFVPGAGGAGTCANQGLYYWYPLEFAPDGAVRQIEWRDRVTLAPKPRPS